jgi:aspartyl-tRNA(Asn)/glutamyl-tRNA(Gln) amidotransferase subunit B
MTIDHTLYFDRKNYFYSDLPKGFQITQQPVRLGGKAIWIFSIRMARPSGSGLNGSTWKRIPASKLHFMDYTLLDYNRAGVPLVEIVSLPDLRWHRSDALR